MNCRSLKTFQRASQKLIVCVLFNAVAFGQTQNSSAPTPKTSGNSDLIEAPVFEVDPFWPKPLPNHWVTGSTIGLAVDDHDNVWTIQRGATVDAELKAADLKLRDMPIGECCKVAPPVLVYDPAGNLIKSWGGPAPGTPWPDSNHGITVDHKGNVWIAGNGDEDTQVLKFTNDGKFLMQLGKHGVHNGSKDTENFWKPTRSFEDSSANEVYISDGYQNRRVIVFDEDTGEYKRLWGAYGKVPNDEVNPPYAPGGPPSKDFDTVHCVVISHDGLVYVCDRKNDRIQVFHKDGTFVTEAFIDTNTQRSGSVWDIAFSSDPDQKYIYAVNGVNEEVNVILRRTLKVVTSFGGGGRQAGEFFGAHNIATDSKGNIYITETYNGARIQKFIFKGIGPVTRHQGPPWPRSAVVK